MHSELYEKVKDIPEEKKLEMFCLIEDILKEVKRKYPTYYEAFENKLRELTHADGLTELEAKAFVAHMENEDGTRGAHYDSATVRRLIGEHPHLKEFPMWDVYAALNMVYSDFYMPKFDTNTYLNLAYKFLNDKDARHDKMKWYAEHIDG